MIDLRDMIADAERPLLIAGGLLKSDAAQTILKPWRKRLPSPCQRLCGMPTFCQTITPAVCRPSRLWRSGCACRSRCKADLVIGVGTRLGDVTTQGYTFPAAPLPAQKVVQVWPDAMAVGHVRGLALGLAAEPLIFLEQLLAMAPDAPASQHTDWSAALHAVARSLREWRSAGDAEDGVVFGDFVAAADRLLADDAIITIDSGNFGGWVQRLMRFGGDRMMLAPASGAMGYGVPGAVAASLRHPERQVVCFVGDGGFLMTGNELATPCIMARSRL